MPYYSPIENSIAPKLTQIEVSTSFKIPSFHIIGLASKEVSESKERILSAFHSSDLSFPKKKVVVNLSPAGNSKHGTGGDLAIALSILSVQENLTTNEKIVAWGELSLKGEVKASGKVFRVLLASYLEKCDHVFFSYEERASIQSALKLLQSHLKKNDAFPKIHLISNLAEAWKVLQVRNETDGFVFQEKSSENQPIQIDQDLPALQLSESLGRALVLSALGKHHVLLLGPKGIGKTTAANALSHLLHSQKTEQAILRLSFLESLNPFALSEKNSQNSLVVSVSPQTKPQALIGGVRNRQFVPGAFSLAHGGVLVADEFLEWQRDSREALREPLEKKQVSLTRTQLQEIVPADFQFMGTANLCPCGGIPIAFLEENMAQQNATCHCSHPEFVRYFRKLSGPILDRIDLVFIHLPKKNQKSVSLGVLKTQVDEAVAFQVEHFGKPLFEFSIGQLQKILDEAPSAHKRIRSNSDQTESFSYRNHNMILRLAFTLCTLEKKRTPEPKHWLEALVYRPDRFRF